MWLRPHPRAAPTSTWPAPIRPSRGLENMGFFTKPDAAPKLFDALDARSPDTAAQG
jgi:hypothetical protein